LSVVKLWLSLLCTASLLLPACLLLHCQLIRLSQALAFSRPDSVQLTVMDVRSKEGQRHAIHTLWSIGKSGQEIYHHLCSIHGAEAVSRMTVYRWVEQFESGRTNLADLPRSGRPSAPSSKALADRILDLLEEDCRMTIREIADRLDTPRSTVHLCLTNMNFVKLSARWVPKLLTADMRLQRQQTCQGNLNLVSQRGGWNQFRQLIVTGDETWVPHFDPPTKQESKVWTLKGSDPPLKARRETHCKKIMLSVFFDCNGPITIDFLEPNTMINADRYSSLLASLKADIQNKRRSGVKPVILHHDNARPHTAHQTMEAIKKLKFDLLPHPPYSPDLAPADFALFPQLKRHLRGHVHVSRDHLEQEVRRVLVHVIPRQIYADAIDCLFRRWEKCVQSGGNYVEKASLPDDDESY
jgi:histone-lysine N-methyltransferase SETMAR